MSGRLGLTRHLPAGVSDAIPFVAWCGLTIVAAIAFMPMTTTGRGRPGGVG